MLWKIKKDIIINWLNELKTKKFEDLQNFCNKKINKETLKYIINVLINYTNNYTIKEEEKTISSSPIPRISALKSKDQWKTFWEALKEYSEIKNNNKIFYIIADIMRKTDYNTLSDIRKNLSKRFNKTEKYNIIYLVNNWQEQNNRPTLQRAYDEFVAFMITSEKRKQLENIILNLGKPPEKAFEEFIKLTGKHKKENFNLIQEYIWRIIYEVVKRKTTANFIFQTNALIEKFQEEELEKINSDIKSEDFLIKLIEWLDKNLI